MTRAVHQFVPALIARDATGTHTLLLREVLREAGWRSEIFAEATHDELLGESIAIERYAELAAPDDVLLYQFSTSSIVAEMLAARPEPLIVDYHNLTAPVLLATWDPAGAARAAAAARQLEALAPRAALGLADSAYNEAGLRAAGFERTTVVPVLVDFERLAAEPDARVAEQLAASKAGGGADWLFVGRLVPSKGQHDLVKALWVARHLTDHSARLHLVGPTPSADYLAAIRGFVADLGLADVVRITGEVSDRALVAYYAAADVYVSCSVHEGFGVPLLEALRVGVPVVALSAGAVADTLGGAGVLLDNAEPSTVAAAVERVLDDPRLRAALAAAGERRVAAHTLAGSGRRAAEAVATVAGPPPAGLEAVGVATVAP